MSGKVNAVSYQPGSADEFYHKYLYDAENRITDVFTSHDNILWERDARYSYYRHGPLARTIVGQQQVQGIDYAYTLQGWLKGINSTAVEDGTYDMGQDGKTGSSNGNIARDADGFSLNYFTNDYKPVSNSVTPFVAITTGSDLFNGNIKAQVMNIPQLGGAVGYLYRYDQLQRLKKMDAYTGLNNTTNIFTPIATNAYREELSYDPNGNILTYLRNREAGAPKNNYQYGYTAGTNRLTSITNSVNTQTKTYNYDAIDNTTHDGMQGMTNAVWNVYGKLQSCTNAQSQQIIYTYSADGQRISKKVGNTEEWCVKDATGNIMLTYTKDAAINNGHVSTKEYYKYGSSLLSIKNHVVDVQEIAIDDVNTFIRGEDNYILADGNGNTKVTISDKKTQHSSNGVTIDYYTADVTTATLHSAYGANAKTYNGGFEQVNFNRQRKSLEIGADAQTALYWEYNGDVGRRWNVDPLASEFPWQSPYTAMDNDPINKIDPTGMSASPIYDKDNGKLLGTDDQGMKGDMIVMDKSDFKQGMAHKEAEKLNVNKNDAWAKSWVDKDPARVNKAYDNYQFLFQRPDYDGFVTREEGIAWAKSHPNALQGPLDPNNTLYINSALLDFGNIGTRDFAQINETTPVNLLNFGNAASAALNNKLHNTIYALGRVNMLLTNRKDRTVRIVNDEATDYDWNTGGGYVRDKLIRDERKKQGLNDTHGFKASYYGVGTLNWY